MLTDRAQLILRAAIHEYINSAMPIGSAHLHRTYDWDISPATIRNELAELEDEGFLSHPYTSAGRIPTDRGYQFFAQTLATDQIEIESHESFSFTRTSSPDDLASHISEQVRSVVYAATRNHIVRRGLERVLEEPEFSSRDAIVAFLHAGDALEQHLSDVSEVVPRNEVAIMIGDETTRYLSTDEYSIMASKFMRGGKEYIVLMHGPKRMDYERNADILRCLCM